MVLRRVRPLIVICNGALTVASSCDGRAYWEALCAAVGAHVQLLIAQDDASTQDAADFIRALRDSRPTFTTLIYADDGTLAQELALRCALSASDPTAMPVDLNDDLQGPGLAVLHAAPCAWLRDAADERCTAAALSLRRFWRGKWRPRDKIDAG
jgi:hypothetical protein